MFFWSSFFWNFLKSLWAPKVAAKVYFGMFFCSWAYKSPQEFASGSKKPKFGQIRFFV